MYEITNLIMFFSLLIDQPSYIKGTLNSIKSNSIFTVFTVFLQLLLSLQKYVTNAKQAYLIIL